jgi:hypothetical protein
MQNHLFLKVPHNLDKRNICTKINTKNCMDVRDISRNKLRLEFIEIIPRITIVSTI